MIKNVEILQKDMIVRTNKIVGNMLAKKFPVLSYDDKHMYFYKTEDLTEFLNNPIRLLVGKKK